VAVRPAEVTVWAGFATGAGRAGLRFWSVRSGIGSVACAFYAARSLTLVIKS
jgi:hypothetical protein